MEKERRRKQAYRKAVKEGWFAETIDSSESANGLDSIPTPVHASTISTSNASTLTEMVMGDVEKTQLHWELLGIAFEILGTVCRDHVNLKDIKKGHVTTDAERDLRWYIRSGTASRTQRTLGLLESTLTDVVGKVDAHGALVYNKN